MRLGSKCKGPEAESILTGLRDFKETLTGKVPTEQGYVVVVGGSLPILTLILIAFLYFKTKTKSVTMQC